MMIIIVKKSFWNEKMQKNMYNNNQWMKMYDKTVVNIIINK